MSDTPYYGPDFDLLSKQDPEISSILLSELHRQQSDLQLIASEKLHFSRSIGSNWFDAFQ